MRAARAATTRMKASARALRRAPGRHQIRRNGLAGRGGQHARTKHCDDQADCRQRLPPGRVRARREREPARVRERGYANVRAGILCGLGHFRRRTRYAMGLCARLSPPGRPGPAPSRLRARFSSSNRANFAWLFLGQILLGYSFCTRGGSLDLCPNDPPLVQNEQPSRICRFDF